MSSTHNTSYQRTEERGTPVYVNKSARASLAHFMLGLIRRLSHSVIPRPDRPWDDDPTSNAPHKPRKRRLSTSEQDDANSDRCTPVGRTDYTSGSAAKRARGESILSSGDVDELGGWSVPPQSEREQNQSPPSSTVEPRPERVETQEVREVTQGVKEVELEDKDKKNKDEIPGGKDVEPESVPLPDEDEVDELVEDGGDEGTKTAVDMAKSDEQEDKDDDDDE